MKPVCVPCHRFMRPARNGIRFVEGRPCPGSHALPGLREPDSWEPYKLWMGDLWQCPDCKAQIIVGVGRLPISEHYQGDFDALLVSQQPVLQVNDC